MVLSQSTQWNHFRGPVRPQAEQPGVSGEGECHGVDEHIKIDTSQTNTEDGEIRLNLATRVKVGNSD